MINKLKRRILNIPILGSLVFNVYRILLPRKKLVFQHSAQYWEDRYKSGGTSGSGSYGVLAIFKSEVLNDFVLKNGVSTVAEFGCGDGAQLALAKYQKYIGFDVAPTSIELCRKRFSDYDEFSFDLVGSEAFTSLQPVDLALSLDVIYHLIEEDSFDLYMNKLFKSSNRFVIIYSYDFHQSYAAMHEKGREFTSWINKNIKGWSLVEVIPNKYPYNPDDPDNTSQANFYIYEKVG
jgi:cyclopropane fatty-acyl-phospholipid synthase-like methyltransferase